MSFIMCPPATAASLTFTLAASEPVTVTGTPRIAIDVGGVTRYANYAAGSGTSSLSFSYAVQAGDFDADGITLAAPLDLNGGTITDVAGNPASSLGFSLPDTATLKIQTYTAAFTTSPITSANANALGFTIAKAPVGASFTYTISSSGGLGSVTGSGTIGSLAHAVTGVDVSGLAAGTLTLSVTVSTPSGGTGAARTATATASLTGALDGLPAAMASYSLRRLQGAYTGPLLRVRRGSDNSERNIAATISGGLDTATLGTFCASASCFVRTWYDQSGNGWDANQSLTGSQPRIVNSGTTEMEGSRPALRYTSSAGQVLLVPVLAGQTVAGSFNAVARSADTTIQRHVVGDRGPCGCGRIIRAIAGGASYSGGNINGATVSLPGSTAQQRIITIVSGPSGVSGALDGVTAAGGTSTVYQTSNVQPWIGGGGVAQTPAGDWIGTISEVVLFNSTLATADRQTLERNQGAYYGITVP